MAPIRTHAFFIALLLGLSMTLGVSVAQAASKPAKPGFLLGSHPSKDAKTARLSLLKQRTHAIPLAAPHPGKIANSLNHRPGKIIAIRRIHPK
jgi:hypothetical protein